MFKYGKTAIAMVLTGALFANTTLCTFAATGVLAAVGPGITQETAESSTSSDSSEASTGSAVIHAPVPESSLNGPGFSGVIETVPAETTPAETVPAESASAAESGELSEGQAAELQAEQEATANAAAEEANQLNNPLIVPNRQPHLQTTVLLNETQSWSQPYVNDQQILTDGQPFSSVSTFMENIHGDLLYRAYNSTTGWTSWMMNGQETPHANQWLPVEAIQYRFAGPVADKYDLYYNTILSDGTETGWAKNGESAGTMGQGLYMTGYRLAFFIKGSADIASLNTKNALLSAHADGMQVVDGKLTYIHGTGAGYTGWAWAGSDRYYFVDSNPVVGWQYIDGFKYYFQEDGRLLQDIEPIIGTGGPFMIRINKQMNCMTVYTTDGENGFIVPVKSFLTSVGDDTPVGTFKTPEKYRWRLMIHDVYTQYATRLGSGLPILIHSIIYDAPNPFTVWASTYNNLGIARSAGCIRLATGDAKWVYDHCSLGTSINIYNSPIPGPFERPTIKFEIPFEQTWDPTDPNVTQEQLDAEAARIIAKFN